MNTLPSDTLAEIVTRNIKAAAVFEKHHLDYCCRGKRSLQVACEEKSLELDTLLNELEESENSGVGIDYKYPFEKLSLSQLIEFIQENHHVYVKKEMPILKAYTEKIAVKHGLRHPELLKIHDLVIKLNEELLDHMTIEDEVVFPKIKEMDDFNHNRSAKSTHAILSLETPFKKLEHDHTEAGNLLDEIRKQTNNYTPPHDACTTYKLAFASLKAFEADLHHHVHLENNILIPKSLTMYRQIVESL